MSKNSVPAVVESSNPSPQARRFTDDFKRDSVRLVTDEKYTFQATAVGVTVLPGDCSSQLELALLPLS